MLGYGLITLQIRAALASYIELTRFSCSIFDQQPYLHITPFDFLYLFKKTFEIKMIYDRLFEPTNMSST